MGCEGDGESSCRMGKRIERQECLFVNLMALPHSTGNPVLCAAQSVAGGGGVRSLDGASVRKLLRATNLGGIPAFRRVFTCACCWWRIGRNLQPLANSRLGVPTVWRRGVPPHEPTLDHSSVTSIRQRLLEWPDAPGVQGQTHVGSGERFGAGSLGFVGRFGRCPNRGGQRDEGSIESEGTRLRAVD